MFAVIAFVSLVAWQGTVSFAETTTTTTTTGKELIISTFRTELSALNLEVDMLKLDTNEIRGMIASLNNSLIISNQEHANEIKTKLIKAFQEEKMFYRETVRDNKESQDTQERDLNTALDNLRESQRNETMELRAEIKAQREHITMLESEIIALKNESGVKQLKDLYSFLDDKLEEFNNNASQNFITVKTFRDLQKKLSEQDDLQKFASRCDGSWVFNSDLKMCLLFINNEKKWSNAAAFCRNNGGRLVHIENAEKNAHVQQMYEEFGNRWAEDWSCFWAGGSDLNSEGSWEWKDDRQAFTYTRWDRKYREPNGGSSENCLAVLLSYNYFMWNDKHCHYERPFICEKVPV